MNFKKTELLKTACEQDLLSVVARLRDRRCSLAKKTSVKSSSVLTM